MINDKEMGFKLKRFRGEVGLTQRTVAHRLGISQVSYCDYENGKNRISLENFFKLSRVFDFSMDQFLTEEELRVEQMG